MNGETISKAARKASVGVETIRFYERKGLIEQPPKPTFGGYRAYPAATIERIKFIREGQELGFSLREIDELLSLRADPSSDCGDVRERAQRKLVEVNDKIALTHKRSANQVFSFGRDQGHYGRILNVTVLSVPTLMVRNGTEIAGYCFTPQDGNSLLSSVAAAAWFIYPDDYEDRIQCLKPLFVDEV